MTHEEPDRVIWRPQLQEMMGVTNETSGYGPRLMVCGFPDTR